MEHHYFTKYFVFLLLWFVLAGFSSCNKTTIPGKETTLRLQPGPGNPRNSEGDFIKLQDGRILFIYTHFTSGGGDDDNAYLAGRYSSDNGKTWTEEDALIIANEGKMNIMSVSLLRLANGKIALFYLRKNSENLCIPYMRISEDETRTWSKAKRCIDTPGYYVLNNDRVIQLSTGRLILPVSLHANNDRQFSAIGEIMCYYSDDSGFSWKKSQKAANPGGIILQEPGLIELHDGRIMLFCRTNTGVQYISFSEDNGERWSPVVPSTIRSPLSPASIERIPDTWDLLLVWNNSSDPIGGKRTPLNLAVSKDEGQTWKKIKNIESLSQGWYCYTAIEFIDGHVLLGFCAGDRSRYNGLETTQITRLRLDWIYSEATPAPFIFSDKNGTVKLDCQDKNAEIRFTLNGSLPSLQSELYRRQPIKIFRAMPLTMQAFADGKEASQIIFAQVGVDVLQDALNVKKKPAPGLHYLYYQDSVRNVADIDKLSPVESGETPRFSLVQRKRNNNFAFSFTGALFIEKQGVYTLYLLSNDGSVLYLNNHKLIDNDGLHGEKEKSAAISLKTGFHQISLKYFQMGGGKALRLSWKGPGFDKTEIPAHRLFH